MKFKIWTGSCVTTPPTTFARSIGILYGMLGLPLAVLTVGNVGKFIGKGSAEAYHFIKNQISQRLKKEEDYHNNNNIKSDVDLNDDKIHRVTLDLVLVLFLIYLVVGAVLLPDYRDENFLSAIFLCFVSLTTGNLRTR